MYISGRILMNPDSYFFPYVKKSTKIINWDTCSLWPFTEMYAWQHVFPRHNHMCTGFSSISVEQLSQSYWEDVFWAIVLSNTQSTSSYVVCFSFSWWDKTQNSFLCVVADVQSLTHSPTPWRQVAKNIISEGKLYRRAVPTFLFGYVGYFPVLPHIHSQSFSTLSWDLRSWPSSASFQLSHVDSKKNTQHKSCEFTFCSGSCWGLETRRQPLSSSEELLWRGGGGGTSSYMVFSFSFG